MNKALGRGDVSDNLSFTNSTADATGKDRRTIERANARGEALGDDLGAVMCRCKTMRATALSGLAKASRRDGSSCSYRPLIQRTTPKTAARIATVNATPRQS